MHPGRVAAPDLGGGGWFGTVRVFFLSGLVFFSGLGFFRNQNLPRFVWLPNSEDKGVYALIFGVGSHIMLSQALIVCLKYYAILSLDSIMLS